MTSKMKNVLMRVNDHAAKRKRDRKGCDRPKVEFLFRHDRSMLKVKGACDRRLEYALVVWQVFMKVALVCGW